MPAHPLPYRRHVGKEAEVAERGALGGETDFVPLERPAFARNLAGELPAAAAVFVRARNELAVGLPLGQARRPKDGEAGVESIIRLDAHRFRRTSCLVVR